MLCGSTRISTPALTARSAPAARGDKFGIPFGDAVSLYARASELPGVRPVGLAVHIGSQIGSIGPYRQAYGRLAELVRELRSAGHSVSTVDCGGGLGIALPQSTYVSVPPPWRAR